MSKPLRYSHHAETVMRERRLSRQWVETPVVQPEWIESDPSGNGPERRFSKTAGRENR